MVSSCSWCYEMRDLESDIWPRLASCPLVPEVCLKRNHAHRIPNFHQHPATRIAMNIDEIYHPGGFLWRNKAKASGKFGSYSQSNITNHTLHVGLVHFFAPLLHRCTFSGPRWRVWTYYGLEKRISLTILMFLPEGMLQKRQISQDRLLPDVTSYFRPTKSVVSMQI